MDPSIESAVDAVDQAMSREKNRGVASSSSSKGRHHTDTFNSGSSSSSNIGSEFPL